MNQIEKPWYTLWQQMFDTSVFEYKNTILKYDFPAHYHNYLEMEIILEGCGKHIYNGITTDLSRGSVSLMRLSDCHEIKVDKTIKTLTMGFSDNFISSDLLISINSYLGNITIDLNEEELNTLLSMCAMCINEKNRSENNTQFIKNMLECICIFVMNFCKKDNTTKTKSEDNFSLAILYLHNNFQTNIKLKDIAKIAHYSPNHFSVVFHNKTNTSFKDYLSELRIKHSKHLIANSSIPLKNIALKSGFKNYNSFYRTFLKETCITPTQYMHAKRKNHNTTGYSWIFGLSTPNSKNKALIYIKTSNLESNTEYVFSYLYSYDYLIKLNSIKAPNGVSVFTLNNPEDRIFKPKNQTHRVTFNFKTDLAGEYTICLEIKNIVTVNEEKEQYVGLNNLTLKQIQNNKEIGLNLAEKYTHKSGNIFWNENAIAFPSHIDK